jgi:hypothetical protein
MEVNKPIFIVGSGRSGTTLLYNIVAGHENVAWFSNYTNRFSQNAWLASFNYLYKNVKTSNTFLKKNYFPRPSEGYNLWDYFHPINDDRDLGASPPFTEEDVKYADISKMKNTIKQHLHYSGTTRFLNKNTRNTRRLRYLYDIFPDGYFIHIIRDGRAVVNSITNIGWWMDLELWYEDGGKSVPQLISEGKDELELAARGWKLEVLRAIEDSKKISDDQYIEIRYEDLTQNPTPLIKKILSFVELEYTPKMETFLNSFKIKNMNYKYKESINEKDLEKIENIIKPLLIKLNYL